MVNVVSSVAFCRYFAELTVNNLVRFLSSTYYFKQYGAAKNSTILLYVLARLTTENIKWPCCTVWLIALIIKYWFFWFQT